MYDGNCDNIRMMGRDRVSEGHQSEDLLSGGGHGPALAPLLGASQALSLSLEV